MKKFLSLFTLLLPGLFAFNAHAIGVFSANGFVCGKKGTTVTCKGPIPGGSDTLTGTGHDIVYLTVNTTTEGKPARYTYFSDTGCLVGYTFNAEGEPILAVASHRGGVKKIFDFGPGKYDALLEFCAGAAPASTKTAAQEGTEQESTEKTP